MQPTSLIDINPASLLRIRLAEILPFTQLLQPHRKDAALLTDVFRAGEAEFGCQLDLGFVEEVAVRVGAEVEQVAGGPFGFEDVGV